MRLTTEDFRRAGRPFEEFVRYSGASLSPEGEARIVEYLQEQQVQHDYTDRQQFKVGDRVELHPGCDLWMQGARFGTVRRFKRVAADGLREVDGLVVDYVDVPVVRMDHPQVRKAQVVPVDRLRHTRRIGQ